MWEKHRTSAYAVSLCVSFPTITVCQLAHLMLPKFSFILLLIFMFTSHDQKGYIHSHHQQVHKISVDWSSVISPEMKVFLDLLNTTWFCPIGRLRHKQTYAACVWRLAGHVSDWSKSKLNAGVWGCEIYLRQEILLLFCLLQNVTFKEKKIIFFLKSEDLIWQYDMLHDM